MGSELLENPMKRAKPHKVPRKTNKPQQLNPNWAQLQQKLKINGSRHPRSDISDMELCDSVLGKRKERDEAEPNDSKLNPLTPVNDDCSLTDAIAMDCEMVGVGEGNKSALGRITLVNTWGNVVYDEFVRPMERVVDFRTRISGIRPQDLRKAKNFPVVQKKVAELIKGRILVGHALHNDLKVLLLSHPKEDIRDTTQFQPYQNEGRKKALRHLASEVLGVTIQNGEHCPVEDARAAMLLYVKNSKKWEKSMKDERRVKQLKKKRRPKKRAHGGETERDASSQ